MRRHLSETERGLIELLTREQLITLEPFFQEINELVKAGDNGDGIAALVNVQGVTPLYPPVVGMVKRFFKGIIRIGVGRDFEGMPRLFLVTHEVCHIKLGHLDLADFLNGDGFHVDFFSFDNLLQKRLIVDTEKDANICSALAVFDDSILDRMGFNILQEIEDTSKNLRRSKGTLASLKSRWKISRDPDILREIRKIELRYQEYETALAHLKDMLEYHESFDTIEDIAYDYNVPIACIQCYLEGKRILGYTVIPNQVIDWTGMLSPNELKHFKSCDDYNAR